ncbi:MAG: putative ABC transporter ATP-binding protein YbhF [Alphaproteobacteria bacterium MarineAlpha3_Bin4]|nr:MAG: putative ABC transporter ATP-binding protein YbhF [Alphaproteobacteria bacterium MarineAlpha3_Bin4]
MIKLQNLVKRFGPLNAVNSISMAVGRGEVVGFLGPNGAGKSTTMKIITGFLPATSGTVEVCGFDVGEKPVEVQKRLGYLPEGAPAYGDMTPASFLDFVAQVRGYRGAEKQVCIEQIVEKTSLKSVLDQSIETLSKGFKRRVGLAQAMLHDPPVLIMDEPTDGLDPNQKHHVRNLIREMAADKAVIVSTHILEEVEAVCTRAVIISEGRLVADGTPEQLIGRSSIHNAVRIELEPAELDLAKPAIEALDEVGGVDILSRADGRASLRVVSKDGQPITVAVGALMREKGFNITEIYTEKGALDEVFRQITIGEDGTEVNRG